MSVCEENEINHDSQSLGVEKTNDDKKLES